MVANNFSDNLLKLRLYNKLTQQELADELSITRQTLSSYERDESSPNIDILLRICELYDVTPNRMLYGDFLLIHKKVKENEDDYSEKLTGYINEITKQGYYNIIDKDLEEFYKCGVYFDLDVIAALAVLLSKKGFLITSLYSNGFGVYIKDENEAISFKFVLVCLIDDYVHWDNEKIIEIHEKYTETLSKAQKSIAEEALTELYDIPLAEIKYHWVDDENNIRGYGRTQEDCMKSAQEQHCETAYIIEYNKC